MVNGCQNLGLKNVLQIPLIFLFPLCSTWMVYLLMPMERILSHHLTWHLAYLTLKPEKDRRPGKTIYFHPDTEHELLRHSQKATAFDKLQNLHNGLRTALESFVDVSNSSHGIKWDYFPYVGTVWFWLPWNLLLHLLLVTQKCMISCVGNMVLDQVMLRGSVVTATVVPNT